MITQSDVKAMLSEVISRGTHKHIALQLGISQSDLSRRFSVHDERKSGIGECVREVAAIATADPQGYPKVKAFVMSCLECFGTPQSHLPLTYLVCEADREADDVIRAWTQDKPIKEVKREAIEAIAALQTLVANLDRKDSAMSARRESPKLRKTG